MLTDQIGADLKQAMLAKDALRLSTLRLLKSAIEYAKIEKKQENLTDPDVLAVIKKQIKQRRDAIDGFTKGGRTDLADKEQAELAMLKAYLPAELSAAELGATTRADMGRVMKAVQAKVAGRADNRLVSQAVMARLVP